MPPAPAHPPEPSALLRAFSARRELNWGENPLSTAEIAELHGEKATLKGLRLLERTLAIEPNVTAEFLDSLPETASPYQLGRRVKSPQSLARKLRDREGADVRRPVEDLLRYTVLTGTSDQLVPAARHTTDELTERGWQVTYAMHSYTDGSRYKGIHAYLRTPDIACIEVQFHSVASVKVKDLTTPWYEIERSANASDDERAAARLNCMEASAQLRPPLGIDGMTALGGKRVRVNNYSDSRDAATVQEHTRPGTTTDGTQQPAIQKRNDGMAR